MKFGLKALSFVMLTGMLTLSSCLNDDGGYSPNDQFVRETELIDEYVQDNGISVQIEELSSIRYHVYTQGTGIQPIVVDSVTINYSIDLMEGGENVASGTEEKIKWTSLLTAARQLLGEIQEGGHIQFFVPSVYAFGQTGDGDKVPPDATLIYDIELLEVHATQLRKDIALIDTYISANGLSAVEDPTGLRYSVVNAGSGDMPDFFSTVNVTYTGSLLSDESEFDSGTNVPFKLSNLIEGWQIGLPKIGAGGTIILYIPSSLGYGPNGSAVIPENANLIFDIDLLSVD